MKPIWTSWRICFPGRRSCRRNATKRFEYDQRGSIRSPAFYSVKVLMVERLPGNIASILVYLRLPIMIPPCCSYYPTSGGDFVYCPVLLVQFTFALRGYFHNLTIRDLRHKLKSAILVKECVLRLQFIENMFHVR